MHEDVVQPAAIQEVYDPCPAVTNMQLKNTIRELRMSNNV